MYSNTVEVFRSGGWWNCRYLGSERAKVESLFGTNVLPSAYRDTVPYAKVFAALRAIPANSDITFVEASR